MKILAALMISFATSLLPGQVTQYSYYYRICFSDKGENLITNYLPHELLSEKAIARRQKAGIPVPDIKDIPVSNSYINQIKSLGLTLHTTSKWMNTALFKTESPADIDKLNNLPFVTEVRLVKIPGAKGTHNDKLDFTITEEELPPFDRPVTMVNGYALHNSGYNGKGILIAVLDGGFLYADLISSLDHLRNRNGIKATKDFVDNDNYVYHSLNHGTAVMSVLSGMIPDRIEGTAQGADYLILRTEDGGSEFPCEEDFWAAGAEFADSAGADIISSSLGYSTFDDPTMNYKYSDLDGNSAFVTRAADIAASKGILVVNSAGNERAKAWKYLICPADGDSVVASGAVDGNNLIAYFSSAGPSADRRIKPDNTTMGVSVPVQVSGTSTGRANGTSFSCPVLSGMAACLMQAVPQSLNTDIIHALQLSGDRYNEPDSLYGYGIPNMVTALSTLQDLLVKLPDDEVVVAPNPTYGDLEIIFRQPPEWLTVEIVSLTGKIIARREFREYAGRTLKISDLQQSQQGLYLLRLIRSTGVSAHKIIKLRH